MNFSMKLPKDRKNYLNIKKRSIILLVSILVAILSMCLLTGCGNRDDKEVKVFCAGDYIDPNVIKDFEKETGINVILDTYDTNEEMYPVIKNRAGVYDVICPSDYMIERMIGENLLAKINTGSMKYYNQIGKKYLDIADKTYDPGNQYSVPYQYGVSGIMYNKNRIKKGELKSWKDLWNKKYKGRILMQDSLRDTIGIALKANGNSLNSTREKDVRQATESLIKQKKLVYKYANDSARDLLIGNSADLGVVWNGEVLYSKKINKDLDFIIPDEGTEIFIDCWAIPKNAFSKKNGEKFIDYMCRPKVAYKNFKYLTYSTPNEGAKKLMSKELKTSPILFPDEKTLHKSEPLRDIGPNGDDLYSKYWKIFKSN